MLADATLLMLLDVMLPLPLSMPSAAAYAAFAMPRRLLMRCHVVAQQYVTLSAMSAAQRYGVRHTPASVRSHNALFSFDKMRHADADMLTPLSVPAYAFR